MKPQSAVDLTYAGIPVMDEDTIYRILESHWNSSELDIDNLVDFLIDGKIVGVVRGNSEH